MKAYEVKPLDFLFFRSLTCVLFHGSLCFYYKKSLQVDPKDVSWITGRNLGGITNVMGLIFAVQYLSLANVQIILSTSPFWTSSIALILLKERLLPIETMCMTISFVLVVCISLLSQTNNQTSQNISPYQVMLGVCFGFLSAIGTSVSAVSIRKMQQVNFLTLAVHNAIFALLCIVFLFGVETVLTGRRNLFSYSPTTCILMCLSSLPNAVGQIFQTIAFQNERSGLLTIVAYLGIVYAFIVDRLVLGMECTQFQIYLVCCLFFVNLLPVVYQYFLPSL